MVRKILHLRRKRGWGPARIADKLGLRSSTVNRLLRREGEPRLHELDLAICRKPRWKVQRDDSDKPGELVHVDIKKLGKVSTSGGEHRATAEASAGSTADWPAAAAPSPVACLARATNCMGALLDAGAPDFAGGGGLHRGHGLRRTARRLRHTPKAAGPGQHANNQPAPTAPNRTWVEGGCCRVGKP